MIKGRVVNDGYTCICGEVHKYPAYVFAHWDEELIHTCEKCGTKHDIYQGEASIHSDDDED